MAEGPLQILPLLLAAPAQPPQFQIQARQFAAPVFRICGGGGPPRAVGLPAWWCRGRPGAGCWWRASEPERTAAWCPGRSLGPQPLASSPVLALPVLALTDAPADAPADAPTDSRADLLADSCPPESGCWRPAAPRGAQAGSATDQGRVAQPPRRWWPPQGRCRGGCFPGAP